MKTGIAGLLVLLLTVITLVLPGCAGVQDHWTIPDDQPPLAEVPAEEAPSPGPVDRDSSRETSGQGEARPQKEETELKEAEAREDARRQEEARLQKEAAERREAEAREDARRQEEARLQKEAAERREAEAREDARRQEAVERREAEARENARRQEEVRRLLEELEETHKRAEAEERARQEAESRRFSGDQAGADPRPRYYVVRPGDTFNSIAADPRIYNNRSEWFTLYQANRNKLENPNNPDLLIPGMLIEIPSVAGEVREGTY